MATATGHANHIMDLHFAAGANTQSTLNTRIQIDGHRDMAIIQKRNMVGIFRRITTLGDILRCGHIPQMAGFIMCNNLFWLICNK